MQLHAQFLKMSTVSHLFWFVTFYIENRRKENSVHLMLAPFTSQHLDIVQWKFPFTNSMYDRAGQVCLLGGVKSEWTGHSGSGTVAVEKLQPITGWCMIVLTDAHHGEVHALVCKRNFYLDNSQKWSQEVGIWGGNSTLPKGQEQISVCPYMWCNQAKWVTQIQFQFTT